MEFWVQYHKHEELGLPDYASTPPSFGIFTNKHFTKSLIGDTVILIVGIKVKGKTRYFLWDRFIIDDWDGHNATGAKGWTLNPPQRLGVQDEKQFKVFRDVDMGRFGFGFQNATNSSYLSTLLDLSEEFRHQKDLLQNGIRFYEEILNLVPGDTDAKQRLKVLRKR